MRINKRAEVGIIKKIDEWRGMAFAFSKGIMEFKIKCYAKDCNFRKKG